MSDLPHVVGGALEIRARGDSKVLSGTFPYGKTGTITDRGRVRKERIEPDAFAFQINRFEDAKAQLAVDGLSKARAGELEELLERANIHVLSGHDFAKPLGDLKRGTARVTSTPRYLHFEVDLPDESDMPSYMLDVVRMIRTGRAGGVSPGFNVPPSNVVPDAVSYIPEAGNPGVSIKSIRAAVLYEISTVSRPVYAETALDLRAEDIRPRRRRFWL